MALNATDTGNLAVDVQNLDKLKLQAKQSPEAALKTAAKQFETVFLNMMLKSMRDATPQDGMFDSEQTRMFTGMLDQQLAQNISSGRGIGLAEIMVQQLSRTLPAAAAAATATPAIKSQPVVPGRSAMVDAPVAPIATAVKNEPVVATARSSSNLIPSPYNQSVQQDFVQRMMPFATQASRDSGIPAHLLLGQAALESGWGKRAIKMADGSDSHNLFGIKAGKDWTGPVAAVTTTEYSNGVAHKHVERFRAYNSYAESFQDHASMMSGNPRYAAVLQQDGAQGFAQALQKSGYATDPRYADKLASVIGRVNTVA